MAEENVPAAEETPKTDPVQIGKFLLPALLFLLAIVAGGSYFLGRYQVNKTSETSPTPAPTASPIETSTHVPTSETTASPGPVLGASNSPTPTASPSPTPSSTPTPSATGASIQLLNPSLYAKFLIFQVTGVTTSVDSPWKHKCLFKETFDFTGKITSNSAGTATVRWERSDGVASSPISITFAAAETKTVSSSWSVWPGTYSMKLHVTSPNDISSTATSFKLSCP